MLKVLKLKFTNGAQRLAVTAQARRFARQQDGVAAVEFALIGVPFLALIFAILETALVFFAGQALETAVADSSRLIMTGQAQNQNFSQTDFKNAVCARIYGLFDCQAGVSVDVRTFSSFASATMPSPLDSQGNLQTGFSYNPGGPGDIVIVRLFYQWPVFVSLLGSNLSNMGGNKHLIVATAAFRNEPYAN
jgi:Flp pilus assembly protein TadG